MIYSSNHPPSSELEHNAWIKHVQPNPESTTMSPAVRVHLTVLPRHHSIV